MPRQQVLDPNDVTSARQPDRPQPHILPSAVRQFGYVPDFDDWLPGDLTSPGILRVLNTWPCLVRAEWASRTGAQSTPGAEKLT